MSKHRNQRLLIVLILLTLLAMAFVWCYFDNKLFQMK